MSTTFSSDPINQFVKLVNTARDYNSKEIRMTREDAEKLALSLTGLLARDITLAQKVLDLQDKLISSLQTAPRNLDLNGGGFR
jgi:hypothetical protein